MDRTKKDPPSREAEETFIFCHEAAEASDAGFTCIFFLCLLLLTRGQNTETWQHNHSISKATLKMWESIYRPKILPSKS